MPTFDKILPELSDPSACLSLLQKYVGVLSQRTQRPVIGYLTAFTTKPCDFPEKHSITDADMQGFMTCMKGLPKCTAESQLDIILHSPGGHAEATKRIISYIRALFPYVRVFVPHLAMSGGTLIALSANEIYMGPYSSLGPTDPQIPLCNRYVPVGAIIREFDQAKSEILQNPGMTPFWVQRLKDLPIGMYPVTLNSYQHAQKDTAELLLKYMLSTDIANEETAPRARGIAANVARHLNTYDLHGEHGKGISLESAQALGLKVVDLSKDKMMEDAVLSVYHAATAVFHRTPIQKIIFNSLGSAFCVQ